MKKFKSSTHMVLSIFLSLLFIPVPFSSSPSFEVLNEPIQPVLRAEANQTLALPSLEMPKMDAITEIDSVAHIATQNNAPRVRIANSNSVNICANYYAYLSIVGKNICLASTDNTGGNLSYSYAYIFNSSKYSSYNQYIFGHNSSNLFGPLSGYSIGTTFSLTVAGTTSNYRIINKEVTCDYSNPSHPCSNYSEPVLNMLDVIRPARKQADLAIMTCAGNGIGGGDATHRLVVYAVKI